MSRSSLHIIMYSVSVIHCLLFRSKINDSEINNLQFFYFPGDVLSFPGSHFSCFPGEQTAPSDLALGCPGRPVLLRLRADTARGTSRVFAHPLSPQLLLHQQLGTCSRLEGMM